MRNRIKVKLKSASAGYAQQRVDLELTMLQNGFIYSTRTERTHYEIVLGVAQLFSPKSRREIKRLSYTSCYKASFMCNAWTYFRAAFYSAPNFGNPPIPGRPNEICAVLETDSGPHRPSSGYYQVQNMYFNQTQRSTRFIEDVS